MSQLSIEDWKSFLKARIEQEQGKEDAALPQFDKLLEKYPDHPHLLASRTIALQRLGRAEEAAASQIAAKYSELGRTLVNDNDKPEVWTAQLNSVLSDLNEFEKSGKMSAALVAW